MAPKRRAEDGCHRAPKVLRVGTDFSGMEMPIEALRRLGVSISHEFACDSAACCKKYIQAVTKPKVFYDSVRQRNSKMMPEVHLYCYSPPCQPFSAAGKNQGEGDSKGRGELVSSSLKFITSKQPRLAIMENVVGLVQRHRTTYQKITKHLKKSYFVYGKVLNTKEHGVPQNRRRIFVVAIRRDSRRWPYAWPKAYKLPAGAATKLLDKKPTDNPKQLPPKSEPRARSNVKAAYLKMLSRGIDPKRRFIAVDTDASPRFRTVGNGILPCMTATRARNCGWWLSPVGRRITLNELFKFQGLTDNGLWRRAGISDKQMGFMLGNSISLNVYERILGRALWAAGLVTSKPRDRWAPCVGA